MAISFVFVQDLQKDLSLKFENKKYNSKLRAKTEKFVLQKSSSLSVICLRNLGHLKVLNDSTLILNESDLLRTILNLSESFWSLLFLNPVWHGVGKQEKCSSLEQPKNNFYKAQ